ncbi:MAG: hypothetical protein CVU50_07680 [Candidatus Cloacimonetes bacterium HGW-Cloacimonetes-3]|nr:MAG: hypothetical protein CVU50_07680 [Candidatus Cloacimonetes bacterium HGW-Cloacimonetes-3]
MLRCLQMMCILLCVSCLGAVVIEYSASANALSGITMLSQSVGDYALSPVVGITGVCSTWHQPFSNKETAIYGLHTAFPLSKFLVASGINYLNHPDYRWQDEYLSLCINHYGFALGATQHLVYEKISNDTWYNWNNDFALRYMGDTYGSEIRYIRAGTNDAAWTLSANNRLSPSTTVCSSYTWRTEGEDSYAVGSSIQIASPLLLQSSWQSEPARFGAGLKFIINRMELMYSVRTHAELSLSHSLDLGVAW